MRDAARSPPSLRYGFKQLERRSDEGVEGVYHHPYFKRGEPELLVLIRRTSRKRRRSKKSEGQEEQPAQPPPPETAKWRADALSSSAFSPAVRGSEPLREHHLAVTGSLGFDRTARAAAVVAGAAASAASNSPRLTTHPKGNMNGCVHAATPSAMPTSELALAWPGGLSGGPFYTPPLPQPLAPHGFGAAHAATGIFVGQSQAMHSVGVAFAPLGLARIPSFGHGPMLSYAPSLYAHSPSMSMMPYPPAPMGYGYVIMGAPPPIATATPAVAMSSSAHAPSMSAGAKRRRDDIDDAAASRAHGQPELRIAPAPAPSTAAA